MSVMTALLQFIWGPWEPQWVHFPCSLHRESLLCLRLLVSKSQWLSPVQLFAIPWTVARQAPLSMALSRQKYCSGLLFPSPGDLPGPGIEPTSPVSPALAGGFLATEPPGKPP